MSIAIEIELKENYLSRIVNITRYHKDKFTFYGIAYQEERLQVWCQIVVPLLIHVLLWTCMSYNIIHKIFISKGQRAGVDSPNNRLVIHHFDGMFCVFVVHTIHQCDTTLFEHSEKPILNNIFWVMGSYFVIYNNTDKHTD